LFSNSRVDTDSVLDECVVFPGVEVGKGCRIRRAVIDAGCRISDGAVIGENLEDDERRFHVTRGGVVLITPEMLGQRIPE
jgi:glucose-1-phosphate adenylyltransferase